MTSREINREIDHAARAERFDGSAYKVAGLILKAGKAAHEGPNGTAAAWIGRLILAPIA